MKQEVVPIIGGLELVTDKLSVNPGSAQSMLNYEIANTRGIRRMDGFSRWDGRRNLATDASCFTIGSSESGGAGLGWYVGNTITVTYSNTKGVPLTVQALVLSATITGDVFQWDYEATILLLSEMVGPYVPVTNAFLSATRQTGSALTINYCTVASSAAAEATYRDLVTSLPGDANTRIPGLHFFNDKLHAVVDLTAIEVTPAAGLMLEGASLYTSSQTAPIGTIALTRPSSTAGRTIIELFDYTTGASLSGSLYTVAASSDLVPNGTFATDTIWTKGANWTISGGTANAAAAASALTSTLLASPGYAYEVTYTISAYTSGSIVVSFGGDTGTGRNAAGTYTETLIATTAAALVFTGYGASFTGSIDNVSCKIVSTSVVPEGDFATNATWTNGAGWTFSGGAAVATASSGTLTSTLAGVNTLKYRVVYTITRSAGSVTAKIGGVSGAARSAAGTYVDFITATGAGVLTFTGASFTGTIDNVAVYVVDGAATYVGTAKPERAALYTADWDGAGGWTRQDMGRLVQYTEGTSSNTTAFFLPYQPAGFVSEIVAAEIKNTGWVGVDSWSELGGGLAWTGAAETDLQTNDGTTVASAANTLPGPYYTTLLVGELSADVLNIPAGAIVRGVEVSIFRNASHASRCTDRVVTIGKTGGFVGANRAKSTFVEATNTEATYGSSTDLWQLSLSPTNINDGGFQVQVSYNITAGSPNANMVVDQIRVKVYYQEQNRKAYVYDATKVPTDQEIEVIHYTVSEGVSTGNGGNGSRKGILVLNSDLTVTDSAKPWQFAPGMQIRTEAAGAGELLAELASDDEPITLPSSYTIAAEDARYQFSDARPYARDDADVFFICSGAEYAYMYADGYALPIQTGLLEQFEKPRHAVWSGNYLALGYATGTLSLSDVGDPLTYLDAASTAAEIGASDRVTGLLKLKGNSLGVFTERTIFAIQGVDPTTFSRVDISPSSGAIEYTVVDMGVPMFCDYRGIATLETTDRYGDFDRPGIAAEATPWLIERLQSDRRNQTVDKTVIAAYPVRNKRQYRMLFNDGWQSTLTLQPDGGGLVTTQRYYGDWQDRDTSAIRVLGLTTGVTSTGQDVAYMSFDVDPESSRYRYVFQIDAGRSFDGEEIIAQWTSQPMLLGAPFVSKKLQQVALYGRAYGYADLKIFAATDFTDPVSDETTSVSSDGYDYAFGTTAASTESNFKFIKALRGEGEDFTFLIESITATELPHTIQAMVVRFDLGEPKR